MLNTTCCDVVIVSNIPTPYRIDFHCRVNQYLLEAGKKYRLIFYAEREPGRIWDLNLESINSYSKIHNSKLTFIKGIDTYLSLMPFLSWIFLSPKITFLAGAWHYPSNILILLSCKLLKRKCFFWCESNAYSDRVNLPILSKFKRLLFSLYDGFIYPGVATKEYLIQLLGVKDKILIEVPNSVSERFVTFSNEISRSSLYKFNKILYVGSLDSRKGVVECVETIRQIEGEGKLPDDFVFNVCGEGPDKQKIEFYALQYKWLKVWGFLQGDRLIKMYSENGALLLNTKLDPSPLVINEAVMIGLIPIVSNRAGNSRDLEDHSPCFNFVFPSGGLKDVLIRYLSADIEALDNYRGSLRGLARRYEVSRISTNFVLKTLELIKD